MFRRISSSSHGRRSFSGSPFHVFLSTTILLAKGKLHTPSISAPSSLANSSFSSIFYALLCKLASSLHLDRLLCKDLHQEYDQVSSLLHSFFLLSLILFSCRRTLSLPLSLLYHSQFLFRRVIWEMSSTACTFDRCSVFLGRRSGREFEMVVMNH